MCVVPPVALAAAATVHLSARRAQKAGPKGPKAGPRGPKAGPKGFGGGLDIFKWSRNFDSGSRSAIFGTLKMVKTGRFTNFGGTKNDTSGARIKIQNPKKNPHEPKSDLEK